MSDKKLSDAIDLILAEVKDLKKIIKAHGIDLSIIKENSNLIQLKVSDLSCKVDMDISTLNITSCKTLKGKPVDDKKVKLNITSYFKLKYTTMPESLEAIVSKAEINALFEKFASEIKAKGKKKDSDPFKITLIYREILKNNADKIKLLRAMKETEESSNTVVDSEIVENNLKNDDDEEEQSEEEDSDDE
jgi:hypothetical protein